MINEASFKSVVKEFNKDDENVFAVFCVVEDGVCSSAKGTAEEVCYLTAVGINSIAEQLEINPNTMLLVISDALNKISNDNGDGGKGKND